MSAHTFTSHRDATDALDCPDCRELLLEAFRDPALPAGPGHAVDTQIRMTSRGEWHWVAFCSCGWRCWGRSQSSAGWRARKQAERLAWDHKQNPEEGQ